MKNFTTQLKETIIERLNDYTGTEIYASELGYTLFENENINGSVLCNTYATKEFIKENFDLFGDLVEYVNDNLDMKLNPFTEPEEAHVVLLLEASQSLLSRLDFINDNWNEKIELNPEVIEVLTDQINELEVNDEDLF